MNTLGAGLASIRSAAETPAGRTARDDENPAAFGTMLGALSEEKPAEARETSAEEADAQGSTPVAQPQGDAASALAILAAIDASAATAGPQLRASGRIGTDTIGTLIARALPAGDGASALTTGRGRLQVAVIAQETHFDPVTPYALSLMGIAPIAPSSDATAQTAADAAPIQAAGSAAASLPIDEAPVLGGNPVKTLPGPGEGGKHAGVPSPAKTSAAGIPAPVLPPAPQQTAPIPVAEASVTAPAATAAASAAIPRMPVSTDAAAARVSPTPPVAFPGQPSHAAQSAVAATARPVRDVGATESVHTLSETERTSIGHTGPRDGEPAVAPLVEARLEIGQPSGSAASVAMPASTAGEPSRQVAEAIVAQVGRLPANAPAAFQPGTDGPLRILTIQLRPDDLGTVLVRMRLRGDQLEMSLHASREETAALLRSDTAALDGVLRSAGYQPDIVTIVAGRADAPTSGEPGRMGAGATLDGRGNDPGGTADQSGGREPEQRDAGRRNTQREQKSDETTSGGSGRIGRYL